MDIFKPFFEELVQPIHAGQLADALEKRPNLMLIVQGRFSPDIDGQALKERQTRQRIVSQQGIELTPGEDPGLLDFGSPAVQTALEDVFSRQFGPEALAESKAAGAAQSDEAAGPTGEDAQEAVAQDPVAWWKDLFGTLVDQAPLAESALAQLAQARAAAVMQALQGEDGLPQHRVMLKPAKALKPGKTPRVKMMLEPMKVKRVKKMAAPSE